MSEAPLPEAAPPDAGALRKAYRVLWGLTLAGLALGVLGLIALWSAHDTVATRLLSASGESLYAQGKDLEASGARDAAIEKYRNALDATLRVREEGWACARALGDLLVRESRYPEAVAVYDALPAEAFPDAGSYAGYARALWRTKEDLRAEQTATRWLEQAQAEGNAEQEVWARSILGAVYAQAKRYEEAVVQYRTAVALDPKSQVSLHLAQALLELERPEEALAVIEAFLPFAPQGQAYEDAVSLQARARDARSAPGAAPPPKGQ